MSEGDRFVPLPPTKPEVTSTTLDGCTCPWNNGYHRVPSDAHHVDCPAFDKAAAIAEAHRFIVGEAGPEPLPLIATSLINEAEARGFRRAIEALRAEAERRGYGETTTMADAAAYLESLTEGSADE